VELLLDDIDEAQRVGGGLVERPLAERAVRLEVGLGDVPLLEVLPRHCCCRVRESCEDWYSLVTGEMTLA
jgi:hypothetical protein